MLFCWFLDFWMVSCHWEIPVFHGFRRKFVSVDFKNALISQPVDGFLFPTPEMKARDAYVPFLLSKPINKIEI